MWYNVIVKKQNPQEHYTAYQLKLPVEIEKIIEISDPVYSFSEVMLQVQGKPDRPSERGADAVSRRGSE